MADGMDVATLAMRVDFRDVSVATQELDKLSEAGGRAESANAQVSASAREAGTATRTAMAEAAAAARSTQEEARAAARATRIAAVDANLALQDSMARLEAEYAQSTALIKEHLARGFITPQEARKAGLEAAREFNVALAEEVEKARTARGLFLRGGGMVDGQEVLGQAQMYERLNKAFKSVGEESQRAGVGLGRLNYSMLGLARQAAGANAATAQVAGALGSLALSGGVMLAATAGLAGLVTVWERVTRSAREARREQEDALEQLREAQRMAMLGPGGRVVDQVAAATARVADLRGELEALRAEEARQQADPRGFAREALLSGAVGRGDAGFEELARSRSQRMAELEREILASEEAIAFGREEIWRATQAEQDRLDNERRRAEEDALRAAREAQAERERIEQNRQRLAAETLRLEERSATVLGDLGAEIDIERRRLAAQKQGAEALAALNAELERERELRDRLADVHPRDIRAITEEVQKLQDLRAERERQAQLRESTAAEFEQSLTELDAAQDRYNEGVRQAAAETASFEQLAVRALENVAQGFGDIGRAVGGLLGGLLSARIELSATLSAIDDQIGLTADQRAEQRAGARTSYQSAVGATALGGAVGFIGMGIASVLSSRAERAERVEQARARWEEVLDAYVDTLADATRWDQLKGRAADELGHAMDALVDAMIAGLPDRARGDIRDQMLAGAEDGPEGIVAALERLAAAGSKEAQTLLDEYAKKLERINEEIAAAVRQQEDEIAIRTLIAQGRDEEAEAMRREIEEREILARAAELGGDALVELWQDLFDLEAQARETAKAAKEAAEATRLMRQGRYDTLDLTARRARLEGDERAAFEAELQAQAERELNALADRLAAGEIEIEMYHALAAVINDEVTAALEAFDEAAKQAAKSAMDNLQLRLLVAHGMDEEAFLLRQQLEYQDAIAQGRSEEYLAMLRSVHVAEQQARARQRAAAAEREHQRALEKTTQAVHGVARALDGPTGFTFALTRSRVLREFGLANPALETRTSERGVSIGSINIQTLPGQDTQAIAEAVTEEIGRQITRGLRAGGYNPFTTAFEG